GRRAIRPSAESDRPPSLKDVPICGFLGRKAEEARTRAHLPVSEPRFEAETIRFTGPRAGRSTATRAWRSIPESRSSPGVRGSIARRCCLEAGRRDAWDDERGADDEGGGRLRRGGAWHRRAAVGRLLRPPRAVVLHRVRAAHARSRAHPPPRRAWEPTPRDSR